MKALPTPRSDAAKDGRKIVALCVTYAAAQRYAEVYLEGRRVRICDREVKAQRSRATVFAVVDMGPQGGRPRSR